MSEVAAATAPSSAPSSATPSAAPATSAPSGGDVKSASGTKTVPDSRFADKGSPPPAAEATEARKEAERRKYKLKIDGQEREEDLSDDEVSVRLQKALGAEKRMQEAAEYRKKFQAASEAIRSDPFAALKEAYGIDIEKLAEERLAQKYQEQLLPENERKELEYKRQIEARDAQLKAIRDAEESKHQEAFNAKVLQETEAGFLTALQTSGLPQNYETLRMMAEVAKFNLEHGLELTPAQIAAEVQSKASQTTQHVLKGLKGESLVKFLGPDVVKEVLRLSVEKIRPKAKAALVTPEVQSTDIEDRKPRNMKSSREVALELRRGLSRP